MSRPLRNPRHEKFVQLLLKGKSAVDAHEEAGFIRDDGNAARLKANPNVAKRLAELQAEIAETTKVTTEGLIAELEEARKKASSASQFSTAVRAVLGKAQLAGLLVEKKEVQVTGNEFEGMDDPREIALAWVDEHLKFKIEPYHDFRDDDRQRFAEIFLELMDAVDKATEELIAEVRARPLKTSYKPPKALPSPHANGKSRY
jgi:hypothetical protein